MFTYLISKQQIYPRYLLCHIYCVRANERYHSQHHINKWLCFLLTEKYRGICMYSLHSFCDFLSFSATLLLSLSYQRPHHPTVAVQLLILWGECTQKWGRFWEKRGVVFTGLFLYFREKNHWNLWQALLSVSFGLNWVTCPCLYSFLAQWDKITMISLAIVSNWQHWHSGWGSSLQDRTVPGSLCTKCL